ncbi:MAG: STAS domain-containing protein [Candidatus Cybelea sp.]
MNNRHRQVLVALINAPLFGGNRDMQELKFERAEPASPCFFLIQLEGEFDLAERERLIDAFAIAQSAPVVAVNLQKTTYIDSTVLQCLVALNVATQKREAKLVLVGLRGAVLRLFQITGLHELFDIRGTLSDVAGLDGAQARRLTIESRPIAEC